VRTYKHLFFDLDHTLWDFRTNSRVVLRGLYHDLELADHGVPAVEDLVEVYEEINAGLWERYERGQIDKDVLRALRFRNTLLRFGIRNDRLARNLGHEYLERTPRMDGLSDGAMALLRDLRPHFGIHIITNGFTTTQATKLTCSRIKDLMDHVITSEDAGANKPDPRIFHRAMRLAGAAATDSLMIGDSVSADMEGARAVGMDHVHFAPQGTGDPLATHRIRHLDELRPILL
jgi:putative hydrolase of the HAD superfamily